MGVNALLRSLQDYGIEPNSNVYAEVGSALNEIFKDPIAAAHFFGKLMKHVGTDNVLWGTDCIIYGSPQPFIEQFRALQIPESMQEQYGYPALDATNKAKILGLNAARLHRVDVARRRCEIETCTMTARKRQLDAELGARRWAFREPTGPRTWGEFLAHAEDCVRIGRPG
ncbi:MAG: amidohydrolase family protein [Deltaproteobacteria bacterium]|nr:amidohydrolase family protein [Deltaproteobacteria bacterium]